MGRYMLACEVRHRAPQIPVTEMMMILMLLCLVLYIRVSLWGRVRAEIESVFPSCELQGPPLWLSCPQSMWETCRPPNMPLRVSYSLCRQAIQLC